MPKNHKSSHTHKVPVEWSDRSSNLPLDDPMPSPGEFIIANALLSALLSGLSGIANEAQKHFDAYSKGEMSGTEFAAKIAQASSDRATFSGAKAVAAFSLQQLVAAFGEKWGKELFKRFAKSNAMTMLAFGIVDQSIDTYKYSKGEIALRDYKVSSMENAGSASGALAGGAAGAVVGAMLPIPGGTFWGATFGSYMGSYGGAMTAKGLGEEWFPKEETDQTETKNDTENGNNAIDVDIEGE